MRRSEIQEKTGLTRKAIEYYEEKGLIKPLRLENGYWNYSDEDLEILNKISVFRKVGLSLSEIKVYLFSNGNSLSSVLRRKECQLDIDEKKKEVIELIVKNNCQNVIDEKIALIEVEESIYEKLENAFPGYFGQLIFSSYQPFGTAPLGEHITMGEAVGGKDFNVFCIDNHKTLPPSNATAKEYVAITDPDNSRLEKMVTNNLWGQELSTVLKKIFYYFQAYPDKYTIEDQHNIVWAATGAYGTNIDSMAQYEEDVNNILKVSLPDEYHLVVFHPVIDVIKADPDEPDSKDLYYQDLAMGYGAAIENNSKPETNIEVNIPEFTNKILLDSMPLIPGITKVKVEKVWNNTEEAAKQEVTVRLYKNGQETTQTVKLNKSNDWTNEFTGLKVVDKIDQKTPNIYTVKEEGENGGLINIDNNKFNVTVKGTAKDGYQIENTYKPTEKEVLFSKTEVNGTEELEGANLKVVEGEGTEGKTVDEWTSGKIKKSITLKEGIYTMIETQAPNGYEIAENITFRVTHDGNVEIKQANGQYKEASESTVKMEDALKQMHIVLGNSSDNHKDKNNDKLIDDSLINNEKNNQIDGNKRILPKTGDNSDVAFIHK